MPQWTTQAQLKPGNKRQLKTKWKGLYLAG